MAREIKFRGIKKGGCDFLFFNLSDYVSEDNGNESPLFLQYTLKPETVGQFTGLKDKNSVDIYDGDINKDGGIVIWNSSEACFCWDYKDVDVLSMGEEDFWCEIIGNIHQNPELLNQ